MSHADIVDVEVIKIQYERCGEIPLAFIAKNPASNLDEDKIHEFVNERVVEYVRLKGGIQFVESIPKNPTGKILRRVLKEEYLKKNHS